MKLELNVEYTLKDNKGYIMAVDQSTPFKTIINFVGDYKLGAVDAGLMYKFVQTKGVAYIYLVKATGYAVALDSMRSGLKTMKLEVESCLTSSLKGNNMVLQAQPYILPYGVKVVDYGDTIVGVNILTGKKSLDKFINHILSYGDCKVAYNKNIYEVDLKHFDYGLPNSDDEYIIYFIAYLVWEESVSCEY